MKKIASILLLSAAFLGSLFMIQSPVYADAFDANVCNNDNLTAEQKAAAGCVTAEQAGDLGQQPGRIAQYIVGIIVGITGSIALVYIILGGVHYMTAAGDPSKIKKAKETIMYAVIGLVVSALAFALTNWIISLL